VPPAAARTRSAGSVQVAALQSHGRDAPEKDSRQARATTAGGGDGSVGETFGRCWLNGGLLLAKAVEGAEAPDEAGAVEADDASIGK